MRALTCAICILAAVLGLTACRGEDDTPRAPGTPARPASGPVETVPPTSTPPAAAPVATVAVPSPAAPPIPTVDPATAERTRSVSSYLAWWESTMRDAETAADVIAGQVLAMADDPDSIRTQAVRDEAVLACGGLQGAGIEFKYRKDFPAGYGEIHEKSRELGEVLIVLADGWLSFVRRGDEEGARAAMDAVVTADPLMAELRQLVAHAREGLPPALTLDQLRGVRYEVPGGGATLDERHVASGDLDWDGIDDAAVVLEQPAPGGGSYRHLAIVVNRDGRPFQAATVELGYQTEVYSVEVAGGQVTAWLHTHRHGEPRGSASLPVMRSYRLAGNGVEIGSVGTSSEDEDRSIVEALVPSVRASTSIPDFTVAVTGRDGDYLRVAVEPIGAHDPAIAFLRREGSGWRVLYVGGPSVEAGALERVGIPESLRPRDR